MKKRLIKKALAPIKKIDGVLLKNGFVREKNTNDCLVVIRDGEIYFLTPYDAIPFYYNHYSQMQN